MTNILWIRVGIILLALAVFAFGVQSGDERVRFAGIGLLALALLLRFVRPRR